MRSTPTAFRRFPRGRSLSVVAFALAVCLLAGGALAQGKPGLDEATQALFDAVLVNDLEAVKASVNEKADLEARDRWGMTPIDLAVDRGHFKIAHFLLSVRNFRRDQDDDRGATAEATVPPPPEPQRPPAGGLGGTLGGSVGGTVGGTVGGPTAASEAPPETTPSPALAAPPPAPAPPVPVEPRGVASREIAPPGAEPQTQLAARPQWLAGQPNPFDPQVAAPGSSLEIIGDVAPPEARPGQKRAPAATPRPAPTVSLPRVGAQPQAPEPAAQAAPPPAPTPQPALTPAPAAPEPVAPTAPEPEQAAGAASAASGPEKTAAAGAAQESESGQGFFGRMLGAIGLGGDEETTEEPAPAAAEETAGVEEQAATATPPQATEPPPDADEQPTAPHVTVESTPIIRSSPEAESVAVAEPQVPATTATVRQTQPRVVIRRTEVVQPEPPAPSQPARATAPAPQPAAKPAPETSPPPQKVAAAPKEEPGFLDRMGSLFSGDDTPPAEGEEKPGFFGRLASLVPDLGGEGSAEESAAEAPAPTPDASSPPATETASGAAEAEATAEDEDSEPKEIRGWIGQALDYVGLGDDEADIQAREEARAAAAAAPKAPPPTRKPGRQVSRTQPVAQPQIDRVQSREPLRGVALTLGETTGLGQAAPPVAGDARRPEGCVTKRRDTMLFCVRPVDWPVEMEPHFRVATIMYQGAKAVVRYADGETARFHAIFPAESFNAVAAYFERRFGPPTDEFRREVRPFASTPLANPALMWQSIVGSAEGERVAVLELRRYDDVRGGFPDTKHGVVMLYWTDAPPIFPQLSSMDLMMIQWSRTR